MTDASLPWIKAPTRLASHVLWRTVPIDERGAYWQLALLGGSSEVRWTIFGSDAQIADAIGCAPEVVTRMVSRLAAEPFKILARTRKGLVIAKYEMHAAPANYDPAAAYGRLAVDRKYTESTPKVSSESSPNAEEKRVEKKRTTPRRIVSIPLRSLPDQHPWWDELAAEYPSVDLLVELKKAQDWHGAEKVKSPKLYFRNWVERAARDARADQGEAPSGPIEKQMRELEERMAVPV